MKKKVLIAVDNLKCGGIQKAFISLANSLDYEKYDVYVLLRRSEGDWLTMLDSNVKIIDTPNYFFWLDLPKGKVITCIKKLVNNPFLLLYFIYSIIHGVAIRNMTKERQYFWTKVKDKINKLDGNYDVAIDFSGTFRQYIADKVDAKTKLTWIHSDYRVYMRDKGIDNRYFNFYKKIICVSETCKEIFDTEFPNFKDQSIVIDNIINKNQIFNLAEEPVDFDNSFDGIKIVDVTRVVPGKNLELAIHTCKKLINAGFKIKWYIIGTGEEVDRLKKITSEQNVQNEFIFLGQKPNPYPYMKRADLFVHCSLFEGRSVAIDEALALGKTVIVTNYPTAKDQITNNVNGYICENNINSLFNTITNSVHKKSIYQNYYKSSVETSIEKLDIIFNG
jgi:glycosyltransferase involved in cell wall biosynthesis